MWFKESDLILIIEIILRRFIMRGVTINIIHGLCQINDSIVVPHLIIIYYCLLQHGRNLICPLIITRISDMFWRIDQKRLFNTSSWDHALRCLNVAILF